MFLLIQLYYYTILLFLIHSLWINYSLSLNTVVMTTATIDLNLDSVEQKSNIYFYFHISRQRKLVKFIIFRES